MNEGVSLQISFSFLSLSLLSPWNISRDHRGLVLLSSCLYLCSTLPPKAFLTDSDTLFFIIVWGPEPAPCGVEAER